MPDTTDIKSLRRVTFTANGRTISLQLDSEWVRSCGIAPDVNTATASYKEFDLLGGDVSDLVGSISFYFTPGAPAADVVLQNVKLWDVEPVEFSVPYENLGNPKADHGDGKMRATKYRLSFADARANFTWPFGGRLSIGEINKEPLDETGTLDANKHDLLNPLQLADLCLVAMGEGSSKAPRTLSDEAKPMNLEWRGSHAPSELEKILAGTNHVMHVLASGLTKIDRIGDGAEPDATGPNFMTPLPYGGVERRGKLVVFTSAPNGRLKTETIKGPKAEGSGTGGEPSVDAWQFVIQDIDDKWKPLTETKWFATGDPIQAVRTGMLDSKGQPVVEEKYRDRVRDQLFRNVRLNPDKYGPAPLRRYLSVAENPKTRSIEFLAKIAVQDPSGTWDNSADFVRCTVTNIEGDGRVLQVAEQLVQVDGPSPFRYQAAKKIGDADLKVKVTRELYEKGADTRWRPKYFNVGFTQAVGGAKKLDDTATDNALADPKTPVVHRPELRLIVVDDTELNRMTLEDQAGVLADGFLRGSGAGQRLIMARGFASGDLNGRVSKITYSQEKLLTTFHVGTWFLPHDELIASIQDVDKGGAAEKYPQQAQTQGQRVAAGDSGQVQPNVPMAPVPTISVPPGAVLVHLASNAAGRGKYKGDIMGGVTTATAATPEIQPEGLTSSSNSNVLILNLREDQAVTLGFGPDHQLPPGYYFGKLVPGGTNGTTVEIDCDRCNTKGTNQAFIHIDTTTEAPFGDHVEHCDQSLVTISVVSRVVYNAGGDKVEYAYFRVLGFECGRLATISAESQRTVFTTGPCP